MINVQSALGDLPHFETFCSVEKLHGLVERLRADRRFAIEVAGTSVNGVPIHHVSFGTGSVKALFVAGPHCHEPIGSLTVFSLATLLSSGHRALLEADVEWHIIPCIDPDGAILNEGWTQKSFTFENYMRNFYLQLFHEQVDLTFPVTYKSLVFRQPSHEARVLKGIIDRTRPDFYYSLHNSWVGGGAYYLISRDIGRSYWSQLQDLLEQLDISLNTSPPHKSWCTRFAAGIYKKNTMKDYYDYLERHAMLSAEEILKRTAGASGPDYLAEIKADALTLVTELAYLKHPSDGAEEKTGQNLRQLRLRMDADTKYLAAVILEEWQRVQSDLDSASPFYRKVFHEVVATKDAVHEGLPKWGEMTRELMFNPAYGKTMTVGDRLNAYLSRTFMPLCQGYAFVRLLKTSKQTAAVRRAIERLDQVFDDALADLARHIDFNAFEVIDCDTLAKAQLGSGLIALNSVLEQRHSAVA